MILPVVGRPSPSRRASSSKTPRRCGPASARPCRSPCRSGPATPARVVFGATTSCPPSGIACWALSIRFSRARRNASRSSITLGRSGFRYGMISIFARRPWGEEIEHLADLLVQVGRLEVHSPHFGEVQEIVEDRLQPLTLATPFHHRRTAVRPVAAVARVDSPGRSRPASSDLPDVCGDPRTFGVGCRQRLGARPNIGDVEGT